MKSLYQSLIDVGIQVSSHESDLYFPRTKESCEILQKYDVHYKNAKSFINRVEGGVWFDVPFAFDPYWAKKSAREIVKKEIALDSDKNIMDFLD